MLNKVILSFYLYSSRNGNNIVTSIMELPQKLTILSADVYRDGGSIYFDCKADDQHDFRIFLDWSTGAQQSGNYQLKVNDEVLDKTGNLLQRIVKLLAHPDHLNGTFSRYVELFVRKVESEEFRKGVPNRS